MMVTQCSSLFEETFLNRYSAPRTIISDKGSYFANKMLEKILSKYVVRHVMGLAYHPQLNGQEEISNREIKKYISIDSRHK